MYRILTFVVFIFSPLFVHAEYIESFHTTMDVESDSTLTVTETIDYVFTEERHGIIREIPLTHLEEASASWKERIIKIDLDAVLMDNTSVPYVLESTKDKFILRIGDADKTLTGRHTYTFTYRVEGGLLYPKGIGTELYWNVTGNEWRVPIRVVETTVGSTDGFFRSERSCYRGTVGESSGSCSTKIEDDGRVTFRATDLFPGEGMTIAQALDATRVPKEIRERVRILLFIIPLAILMLLYGSYRLYRYKTANKTDAPIIAQYEPYPGMKPMYTGLLIDGRLDARDITACIVYLAEQGYLKIRKVERKVLFLFEFDDYEVELIKLPNEAISQFEKTLISLLFNEPVVQGKIISLAELKGNTTEQRENYKELESLKSALRDDLLTSGFNEKRAHGIIDRLWTYAMLILFVYILIASFFEMVAVFLIPAFIILFIGSVVYFSMWQRRSRKGYEVLDYLKGFKLFLETTEKDKYVFHNAPEKSPEQFMEFLPYAIAFGVEEKWAKVFEGITIPNPGWYDGGSVGSFSAMNLTSSLGAFSTAFADSSGTSASSGGGSSGGGVGGGGGGSW